LLLLIWLEVSTFWAFWTEGHGLLP